MSILIDKNAKVICQALPVARGLSTQNRLLHTALKWLAA